MITCYHIFFFLKTSHTDFKLEVSQCKRAGAGFPPIANPCALVPRTSITILSLWQSALQCSVDCQSLPSDLISDLWQSALKCRHRTLAIISTAIFVVAIRGQHTTACHGRVKDLSAEFSNRVKSFYIKRPPV
jgi:hypothetical protein